MPSVRPQKSANNIEKLTPNLLPCRIHLDGQVTASHRYWDPKTTADGALESYFRGRKLKGTQVKIPDGYQGVAIKEDEDLKISDRSNQRNPYHSEEEEEGRDDLDGMKTLNQVAKFDEIVVWGHEVAVDGEDGFVKGVAEWINFAEAVSLA